MSSASDNVSLKSKAPTTPAARKVGFRPTLIIPPPQGAFQPQSPYTTATLSVNTATPHLHPANNAQLYGRKASVFMFDQFNGIKDFTIGTAKSGLGIGEKCSYWMYNKIKAWSRKWFTHFFLTIVILIYTVGGALIFVAIEGQNEEKIVEGDIKKERYNLIHDLRNLSIFMPRATSIGEWEGEASRRLMDYESKVIDAYQKHALIVQNRGDKVWTFLNAIVYCSTIYTTIGYGHMYPTTITGRALTIVYSIIGIPLFLIALTDFGKLFTRCIKFLWSFVRRLYYTGSCRQVRKTAHVHEIFKGAQMMYEIATFRRPSANDPENPEMQGTDDTPTTPGVISSYEIDDEFNLPISVAIFILIGYIFFGALIYSLLEQWDFFASFYFVFISMSTIGFGDFVPRQPICMIVSIVYLVFGLALMSMCINVVQVKLSDTFAQASQKIGQTIGLEVDMDGSVLTVPPENVEVASVHGSVATEGAESAATPASEKSARSPKTPGAADKKDE